MESGKRDFVSLEVTIQCPNPGCKLHIEAHFIVPWSGKPEVIFSCLGCKTVYGIKTQDTDGHLAFELVPQESTVLQEH